MRGCPVAHCYKFISSSGRDNYEIQPEEGTVALNGSSYLSFKNKSMALNIVIPWILTKDGFLPQHGYVL